MKLQRHHVFLQDFGKQGIYVQREKTDPNGRWVLSEDVKILEDLYASLEKVCDTLEIAHHQRLGAIEGKDLQ